MSTPTSRSWQIFYYPAVWNNWGKKCCYLAFYLCVCFLLFNLLCSSSAYIVQWHNKTSFSIIKPLRKKVWRYDCYNRFFRLLFLRVWEEFFVTADLGKRKEAEKGIRADEIDTLLLSSKKLGLGMGERSRLLDKPLILLCKAENLN